MKITPFQGIIDQSIVTNKMLINMNANIGNLASEIRNAFKGNSVQKLNKDLTETKKPVDDIVLLLDELQKELKACGNVDIAKSVEKFEQKLKTSKSTAEYLMNSLNGKIKGKYNQETADYFDKQLFIGEQNEVFTFLQELQKELRACGDIDTAKSIKEFEQQLHKTVSTSEEQIGKIKNKIDNLFSSKDGSNFLKALEPKQAEITIDTVIKQLQELQRQYSSIGDTKSSSAISEYLKQLKTDTIDFEGELQTLKSNLGICLGTEEVEKFEQSFRKAFEPPSETEQLTTKLKEVEQQLSACGETAKANKIKEFLQQVSKETTNVKGSMQELRQYIEKTFGTEKLKQFDKELKNINKTTKNVSKKSSFGSNLKTALGIGTVALGIRKAVSFFQDATNESIDFVETQNLFNVSMGKTIDQYGNLDREASKYYTKAMAFQEKLSDKLKINIEESMEYQALFNAMSKSMGIGEEPSYKISENFTKLGYDLSSLYNIDPENAMQKLRAGLSGQTKPLRDLGLDITQQSLEPLLDELGIERSVKQLSQAEKMIARYIVVLRQASLAHGDFANTINSPANQLRIFNAQLIAFKRNMGSLWQGLLGNILPYVNAIMMVINELLKMVAKLFNIEVADQNVNLSNKIGVDDVANDLDTAVGKVKEFKKQLMGFDEINNITLPDNSSSGIGGAGIGGIDQRLLDMMGEYNNRMDKVKSKADDIKNAIMKWLGFTGDTNKDMKILKGLLDKIKTIAKVILALYIGSKVLKLIGYIRTLKGVFTGIVAPTTSFQNGLALVGKGISNLKTYLKLGVEQFKIYRNAGDGVIKSLAKTGKEMYSLIPNTVKLAGGIAGLTGSSVLAYKSMEDLKNGTIGTGEALGKLTVGIGGATASGAMLGSVIPGVGTAFGALTGFIIGATSALLGFNKESESSVTKELNANLKEQATRIEEIKKSYDEAVSSINSKKEASLLDIEVVKEQSKQLEDLIDSNGRVKDGYQERVSIILNDLNEALGTEYTLTRDQITQNGELYKSYNDLKENIDTYIAKRKEQIEAEAYEDIYKEKIKKRLELEEELKKATDIKTQAEQNYQEAQENTINKSNHWTKSAYSLKEVAAKMTLDEAIKGQQSIQEELKRTQEGLEDYTQDWENHLKGVNNTVETNTQETVNIINNKKQPLREATSGLRRTVKEELQKIDTTEHGEHIVGGLVKGIDKNKQKLQQALSAMSNGIEETAKKVLGIHSPSRIMRDRVGKFIPLGIAEGIDNNANTVFNSIKNLNHEITKEFSINPNDFKIDTNQFIDYGQISGKIATQSNISVSSDIEGRIENAIYRGLSNATIPVEIEATTDEGVIFKKIQAKASEYKIQTGEPAFEF